MTSEPTWCFGKDSLGVTLMPGKYVVRINKGLKYSSTHSEFGNRITSDNLSDSLPGIFVYGCS